MAQVQQKTERAVWGELYTLFNQCVSTAREVSAQIKLISESRKNKPKHADDENFGKAATLLKQASDKIGTVKGNMPNHEHHVQVSINDYQKFLNLSVDIYDSIELIRASAEICGNLYGDMA